MNEHLRPAPLRAARPTTQAADGVPRWRWTTAEVLAMVDARIFHPDERIELIEGEIVPMPAEGRRHATVSDEVAQFWHRLAPAKVKVSVECQFNLGEATYTKPDLLVRPVAIKAYDLKGPDALLIVEVADTSLAYDSALKAHIYAKFGVREYWTINAATLDTTVFTQPSADGVYQSKVQVPPSAVLTPHLAPALAVCLGQLDLT
jgi:Uma2 family endonuclease